MARKSSAIISCALLCDRMPENGSRNRRHSWLIVRTNNINNNWTGVRFVHRIMGEFVAELNGKPFDSFYVTFNCIYILIQVPVSGFQGVRIPFNYMHIEWPS